MCGIVGYVGPRPAAEVLLGGLQRLEYRGYDSAGLAVYDSTAGTSRVAKTAAKVAVLAGEVAADRPPGGLGIGHTRWATHGPPTVDNAHPHADCSGRIRLVHNGIVENFQALRSELAAAGHRFRSETDTEVLPHLIESCYGQDLVGAVRAALSRVTGAYALALYSESDSDLLVGARLNAPLVVGIGQGEHFLASDVTALLPYTRRVLVLGEGQVVALTRRTVEVVNLDGSAVEPTLIEIDLDVGEAEKGGYPHYMLKEIHQVPTGIRDCLRGRVDGHGEIDLGLPEECARPRAAVLLGMGTSLHAALVGEQLLTRWAGLPARALDASEYRYGQLRSRADELAIAITQSGETADTIAALRQAKLDGAGTLAVTNVLGSTAAREADSVLFLRSGPEIGVASTKTFIGHVVTLALLAAWLGRRRGSLTGDAARQVVHLLQQLDAVVTRVLELEPRIAELAVRYAGYRNFLFAGRGIDHPVALEGALKLKEISYLHAEAISAGGLKHGPIAMLDERFPVVAVAMARDVREKTADCVHEVAARRAPVLALVPEGDRRLAGVASDLLELPDGDPLLTAVAATVAMQLFAYHVAAHLGADIDQPRNLAKCVTVE